MSIPSPNIMTDRECSHCGYNLRGLPSESRCPECGTPCKKIFQSKASGTMSIEASTNFVRMLRTGFMLASIGAIGIIGMLLFSAEGLLIITSFFWVSGIWMVTSPRQGRGTIIHDDILDNDRFRLIIRFANFGWLAYGLSMLAVSMLMGGAGNSSMLLKLPLLFLVFVTGAVSWISLIPTSIYLAELSYWASNDRLAQRLRSTAWTMAFFGILTVVLTAIRALNIAPSGAAAFLSIFTILILVICVFVFLIAVLQLSSVMNWVIKHQHMSAGSADRVRKRIERDIQGPGKFVTGIWCDVCKYDLDGLPQGGKCPECGEPYEESTHSAPVILDPANMYLDRDRSEIEIEEGDNKGIYFNTELDAYGKPKVNGRAFTELDDSLPDEGDIPLADGEEFIGDPDNPADEADPT